MSERDTQFQGFAHALFMEFIDNHAMVMNWDKFFPDIELIIARRAYDLACHVIRSQAQGMDLLCLHDPEWMRERVELAQDMSELPKEQA